MKTVPQYTVDAFTDRVFAGNPAAVCLLDDWPNDQLLLNIAQENNLSETAFVVPHGQEFQLRWFTPKAEIDLCGHATLAAAFALAQARARLPNPIRFHTQSGVLAVSFADGVWSMDFPVYELKQADSAKVADILGITPQECHIGRDLLCVLDDEQAVYDFVADDHAISRLDGLLLHLTARSSKHGFDCVSRSFAPKLGISEDPVCGSGHCHIFPYWAKKLGKTRLTGFQASRRTGVLHGELADGRIVLGGQAVLFAQSEIFLP